MNNIKMIFFLTVSALAGAVIALMLFFCFVGPRPQSAPPADVGKGSTLPGSALVPEPVVVPPGSASGLQREFAAAINNSMPAVVLITAQNETPGLGANVCQRQFRKTIFNLFDKRPEGLAPNPVLDQFSGKVAEKGKHWRVKKDGGSIDYVTGATITSRAVTELTDKVAQCYLADGAEIRAELEKAGGNEK